MKVRLVAVGERMPAWVESAVGEYAKRLNGEIRLEVVEIAAGKRTKASDLDRIREQEGERMLAALAPDDRVIALDVGGKALSTEAMAAELNRSLPEGRNVALLVGGPEGLAQCALARARERWSLSALTLPHPLVRVLVAEQVYRCWSLLRGHPYHR
ncbi:MAG: 23S rRNA (pseudouridine(1915)-N(3))-methyltransferase RlmH [Gammaproteobacteria bacterium]